MQEYPSCSLDMLLSRPHLGPPGDLGWSGGGAGRPLGLGVQFSTSFPARYHVTIPIRAQPDGGVSGWIPLAQLPTPFCGIPKSQSHYLPLCTTGGGDQKRWSSFLPNPHPPEALAKWAGLGPSHRGAPRLRCPDRSHHPRVSNDGHLRCG